MDLSPWQCPSSRPVEILRCPGIHPPFVPRSGSFRSPFSSVRSLLWTPAASAQGMGGRHGGKSKSADSDSPSTYKAPPTPAQLTPHGGEYFRTETNYYEVVY